MSSHLKNLWPCLLVALLPFSSVLSLEFDYLVIGGGTSGLTVANRLSELPNITVAVIEAGGDVSDNPNVTVIENFTKAIGTPIDWQYESTNQTYAAGRRIAYGSGKALGGTSTINGMTYIRAEKAQIDSWETIGNKGWNWDSLFPYYKKSESLEVPTAAQSAAGASYVGKDHGSDGPLKIGYPYGLQNGSLHEQVEQGWGALGMPHNTDVNGGSVRGFNVWQSTVDRDANVREDAARAYYYPFQDRPNLHVFLNSTVNRIIWKDARKDSGEAVAQGVEVTSQDGTIILLGARKEVIVSAGSLRTPAILELSGIGNPLILNKYEIPIEVDLPGVGENLQDQPNNAMGVQTNSTFNGTTGYVTYGSASDFFGDLPDSSLADWASQVSSATKSPVNASALEFLLGVQHDLVAQGVPDSEVFVGTTVEVGSGPSNMLLSAFWVLMPFSRGNVHIGSSNPQDYPEINPNFFLIDFDLSIQIAIAKWARKFWAAEPMKEFATEILPGFDVVPANATDEEWGVWVKTSFTGNSHPIGTASMMPKELGGVVDDRLKVYGTANVRVVDASMIPFQVSGHLSSTIYAVSEKAADIIKEDISW